MEKEINLLVSGIVLGLSAGLSPGPLMTLVISETLKHDVKEGIKVSIAPLLTDIPILLVSIFILARLSQMHAIIGAIALSGGVFLCYLGYESLLFKGIDFDPEHIKPDSIKKGFITNALNPNPYLFWLSIGGPIIISSYKSGIASAFMFISGFYVFLVGSKIFVSIIINTSKTFLKSSGYVFTIRFLGIILFVFAAMFFYNSMTYFGIMN